MNNHDFYVHVIGVALLIGSGFLSLRIEDKRLKRRVSSFFVLVLGLLLADAVIHLLPNAIAGFIYGSQHHSSPGNLLIGHER
jgi:hypothetical protein